MRVKIAQQETGEHIHKIGERLDQFKSYSLEPNQRKALLGKKGPSINDLRDLDGRRNKNSKTVQNEIKKDEEVEEQKPP